MDNLLNAILNEDYQQIDYILQGNINQIVSLTLDGKITALVIAVQYKKFNVVRYLLNKGASPKVPGTITLLEATMHEDFPMDLYKKFIEMGVDINQTNRQLNTPLFNVAFDGNYELIKYFLDNGAEVNRKTIFGVTPIMNLVGSNNFSIKTLKLFIEHGAKTTFIDSDGESILDYAKNNPVVARNNLYFELIKELSIHEYNAEEFSSLLDRLGINDEEAEETTVVDAFNVWWNVHFVSKLYSLLKMVNPQARGDIDGFKLSSPDYMFVQEIKKLLREEEYLNAFVSIRDKIYQEKCIVPFDLYAIVLILIMNDEIEGAKKVVVLLRNALRYLLPPENGRLSNADEEKKAWIYNNSKLVHDIFEIISDLEQYCMVQSPEKYGILKFNVQRKIYEG